MDWLVEALKLLGGVLAIPTAAFIVYDRLVRYRPIFALHAEKGSPGDNYLFLRIKNVVDEDIVIENWNVAPPIVGLSTDASTRSIGAAVVGNIPRAILPPLSSLTLVLFILGSATDRDNDAIEISAEWSSTRKPWPFRRRVKIETTVAKLKEWKAAHIPTGFQAL
jgi:hypothetical protein